MVCVEAGAIDGGGTRGKDGGAGFRDIDPLERRSAGRVGVLEVVAVDVRSPDGGVGGLGEKAGRLLLTVEDPGGRALSGVTGALVKAGANQFGWFQQLRPRPLVLLERFTRHNIIFDRRDRGKVINSLAVPITGISCLPKNDQI